MDLGTLSVSFAANLGNLTSGFTQAQKGFATTSSAAQKMGEELSRVPDFNAGKMITGEDVARAKLALIESDVNKARDALKKLEDAANAGKAVSGIDEARAKLTLLEANAQDARQKLEQLGQEGVEAGNDLERGFRNGADAASQLESKIQQAASAFTSNLRGMRGGLLNFGSQLGLTVMGVKELASSAIELGSAMMAPHAALENVTATLSTLLKSDEAAVQMVDHLREFSDLAPAFDLTSAGEGAAKLLAMGFAAEEVIPLMYDIGNAVAGMQGSAADLEAVSIILGQINATGKLTWENLQQLTERGMVDLEVMAKKAGMSTQELMDAMSSGSIDAKEGIDLIRQTMEETFGNDAMANQAATFDGAVANLQANLTNLWMLLSKPLFEAAKVGLQSFSALLESPVFQQFATGAAQAIAGAFTGIGQVLGSFLLPIWESLQRAFANPAFQAAAQAISGELLQGLQQLGSVINGAVSPAIHALIANFTSPAFVQFAGTIATSLVGALTKLAGLFGYLQPIINAFFQVLTGGGSSAIVTGIFDTLGQAIGIVTDLVSSTLMPAFLQFMDFLSSSDFTAFSENIMESIGVAMEVVGQIIAAIIPYFQTCLNIFMQMLPPLMKIGNAILAILNPALRLLGFLFQALMPILSFIAQVVGFVLVKTFEGLAEGLTLLANIITGTIDVFVNWGQTTSTVQGWWQAFVDWFMGIMSGFGAWLGSLWAGIQAGLSAAWSAIVSVVQAAGQNLLNIITAPFRAIGALFIWLYQHNRYFRMLIDAIRAVVSAGVAWLQNIWNQAVNTVVGFWNGMMARARAIWAAVTVTIQAAINQAVTILKSIWTTATSWLQTQWNKFTTMASAVWAAVSAVFQSIWSRYISKPLSDLWNNISKWFTDLASGASRAASNFISLLANGISSGAGRIWDAVKNIAGQIWKALGFESPTEAGPGRTADQWMPNLISMMSSGLESGASQMHRSALLLASSFAEPLQVASEPLSVRSGVLSPVVAALASSAVADQRGTQQEMVIVVDLDGNTLGRFNTRYQDGRVRAKFGMRAR